MRYSDLPCVDDVDGCGSPDRRQIAAMAACPDECAVPRHFQLSSPLTSNPAGAILFLSSWSATEFLNSRPPSRWVARHLPLTPRTECGSTAVRCQAASATDRAEP